MKHRDKLLWTFPRVAIVVLLLFCTISTAPAQTTLPAEDIAEKALAATVYLEMKDKNGETLGIGSGFFVRHNLIATNYHVIEGAAKGTAKLVGKYIRYKIEGVTTTDKTNDLALLKVTAYRIKPLSLGNSDVVKIGATVYVAGNPKGLEGTFSDGIISSRRDKYTKERLQMTAPISPGSSGGPVLNKKGEVIGVSFAGHRALDAQNLNFAIPSKYLKVLLPENQIEEQTQHENEIDTDNLSSDLDPIWHSEKWAISPEEFKAWFKYRPGQEFKQMVESGQWSVRRGNDILEHLLRYPESNYNEAVAERGWAGIIPRGIRETKRGVTDIIKFSRDPWRVVTDPWEMAGETGVPGKKRGTWGRIGKLGWETVKGVVIGIPLAAYDVARGEGTPGDLLYIGSLVWLVSRVALTAKTLQATARTAARQGFKQ